MRVIQVLPTLSFGDAIGNDTIALKRVITEMGYDTEIYAEIIDKRLPQGTAVNLDNIGNIDSDDVLIYHKSTGTELSFKIERFKCRRIMIYHNITPPSFFRPYSPAAAALTEYGYEGVENLRDKVEYCIADSNYNKSELRKMGYTCPIDVIPVLIRFDDYKQVPDTETVNKYSDGKVNLLFVGRIAPNKCQEDVIRSFYCYKRLNPESRLILAGSYAGMENYYERLVKYTEILGIKDDVIFTGHIKFSEILAYYRAADVFVCMSRHEGFCVPLVESMFFDVPVIAFNSSAISDTLGDSGVLIDDNSPDFVARIISRIVSDDTLRSRIIEGQRARLKDFSYESVSEIFRESLRLHLTKHI